MTQKYIIIGNGPAGISALQTIVQNEPKSQVTVLGDEEYPPYSRILIAYYLEDRINREQIFIHNQRKILSQPGIEMKYPSRVKGIDTDGKLVKTEDDESLKYDKLLIASGASPELPADLEIDNSRNVFTVRNLNDVENIKREISHIQHCLFLGGGMISLKIAQPLIKKGVKVDIAVRGKHIISQRLDDQSAEVISRYLKSNGVVIYSNENPVKIIQKGNLQNNKKVVLFRSGREVETEMVIVGKGVKANTDFLDKNQIEIESGILVNQYLQSSKPDIYAAGDVVEMRDEKYSGIRINPIWPNAVEQGRIAALNMIGKRISYRRDIAMNALHLFDLPIISMGIVSDKEASDFFVIEKYQEQEISFQKFFFQQERLVGAILVGPNYNNAGVFRQYILNAKKIRNKKSFFKDPQNVIACLV